MSKLDDEIEKKPKGRRRQKQKQFRYPAKVKRLFRQADKKLDSVVIQYLTKKYQVRWLLGNIIGGNIIVVNNKVHKIDPKCIFRERKKLWYIVREIDREPVSNRDYPKVKQLKRDTDADVPLIKAVLGAVQKPNPLQGKNLWIILAAAVVGIIILVTVLK